MPYRIPSEETLSDAIGRVMAKHRHVPTQRELTVLVRRELAKEDELYRVGEERVRRVGIETGAVRLTIDYHETDITDLPDVCPVCRNTLSPVMNMSLEGNVVEVKRKCTVCSYSVGKTVLVPARYGFTEASGNRVSDNMKRIRKLERAKAKMKDAAALISDALKMSGLESRAGYSRSMISDIIGSKDESGSISNLISDLKAKDRDDPLWSRATVSVKNTDRKDI